MKWCTEMTCLSENSLIFMCIQIPGNFRLAVNYSVSLKHEVWLESISLRHLAPRQGAGLRVYNSGFVSILMLAGVPTPAAKTPTQRTRERLETPQGD